MTRFSYTARHLTLPAFPVLQRYACTIIPQRLSSLYPESTVSASIRASSRYQHRTASISAAKKLPDDIEPRWINLLGHQNLYYTVTSLGIHFKENKPGRLLMDASNILVSEDLQELRLNNEASRLHDIESLGCAQNLESKIIVKLRFSSDTYLVWVEGQSWVERKLLHSRVEAQKATTVLTTSSEIYS